jgi:hypothetical protein
MKKDNDTEVRKYLQNKFDPNSQHQKLKSYSNAFETPLYITDYHEKYEVNIKPDSTIARGKFIPTLNPREYKAHPVTIQAMRKEIFMGEEDFVDLECIIQCESCKTELDVQFWHFCPFCEASFKL